MASTSELGVGLLVVAAALFACRPMADAGCTKDTDCKGSRVCVAGECRESNEAPSTPPATPPTAGETVAQPSPSPVPSPPPEPTVDETVRYVALLGAADHSSSKGVRLTTAMAVLQQDRANYHQFQKRDAKDEGDAVFGAPLRRVELCSKARLPGEVERTIVDRMPLVRVEATPARGGYECTVTVLDPGEPAPRPPAAKGCVIDGVIYDARGNVEGCVGGGNWCANTPPLRGGCPR